MECTLLSWISLINGSTVWYRWYHEVRRTSLERGRINSNTVYHDEEFCPETKLNTWRGTEKARITRTSTATVGREAVEAFRSFHMASSAHVIPDLRDLRTDWLLNMNYEDGIVVSGLRAFASRVSAWCDEKVIAVDVIVQNSLNGVTTLPVALVVRDERFRTTICPLEIENEGYRFHLTTLFRSRCIKIVHDAVGLGRFMKRFGVGFGSNVFGTRIAAEFLLIGHNIPYEQLIEHVCYKILHLDYDQEKRDWLSNVLSAAQIKFAAQKVSYLYDAAMDMMHFMRDFDHVWNVDTKRYTTMFEAYETEISRFLGDYEYQGPIHPRRRLLSFPDSSPNPAFALGEDWRTQSKVQFDRDQKEVMDLG